MKYIYSLFFLVFVAFTATAQIDNSSGGIAIPRGDMGTTEKPNQTESDYESPFSIKPKEKNNYNYPKFEIGKEKSKFSMYESNDFVSRGQEYADRVNVKTGGESNEAFRGNQHFGEYRTSSEFIKVMARDFGLEDGDRIKVLVNDEIVISDITLVNSFRGLQITLKPGFNKIDFEALNQGTSGPNTAEFRVYDDNEKLISGNQWNLATGFKATVMVIKE